MNIKCKNSFFFKWSSDFVKKQLAICEKQILLQVFSETGIITHYTSNQQNRQPSQKKCNQPSAEDVERVMYTHINPAITAQKSNTENENRQQPTPSDFRRQEEKEQQ